MSLFKRNLALGILAIIISQFLFSCTTSQLQSSKNYFPASNELAIAQINRPQEPIQSEISSSGNNIVNLEIEPVVTVSIAEKQLLVREPKLVAMEKSCVKSKKMLVSARSNKLLNYNSQLSTHKIYSKPTSEGKSQLIALALAIFLGAYGAHRFYLGYNEIAITQIILLAAVLLSFIAAFAVGFLLIEPILIFALYGVGIVFALINSIWVIVDIVKIAIGDLKPKDGEYTETL